MSGFLPVRLNQFIQQYLRNNKGADGEAVRAAVEEAIAAWRQGVRCACGKPLWVAGSAVAGYGCFSCITGSPEPDGDPEIDVVFEDFLLDLDDPEAHMAEASEIIKRHPHDYRERLEEIGFAWQDEEDDQLYEEETQEERLAVPQTTKQRRLVRFLETGGPVTRQILDLYLEERYAESSNLALVRKYFKQANPNLKAIILKGLALHPTDADLLDDLSYFGAFDGILAELIHFYTDACIKETDMERFSLLAQDFHMNTFEQGYDALYELNRLFQSGAKGAVVQHLSETIDAYGESEDIPF